MKCTLLFALTLGMLSVPAALLADEETAKEEKKKQSAPEAFELRYKFQTGDVLHWKVTHRALVRTTVGGTTQVAETLSRSVKEWRVSDVRENGTVTFAHLVKHVEMVQKVTGREDVTYDSRTDETPPPGYEHVAESVGRTLAVITMDPQGKVLRRQDREGSPTEGSQITIPLPDRPVAAGDSWSVPDVIDLRMKDGSLRKIETKQKFTLKSVAAGLATIQLDTQILTPVNNPELQVQLVQKKTDGEIKFDIDLGRVVGQQLDADERVVGFQTEASSMHYTTRFEEEFIKDGVSTAAKQPVYGPAPPPMK